MRIMIFISLLLLASCTACDAPKLASVSPVHDTVYVPTHTPATPLFPPPLAAPCHEDSIKQICFRLSHEKDSIARVSDTLAARLLHARLVISNVRYYLNITVKNPTQDKFLKGWIRRALQ